MGLQQTQRRTQKVQEPLGEDHRELRDEQIQVLRLEGRDPPQTGHARLKGRHQQTRKELKDFAINFFLFLLPLYQHLVSLVGLVRTLDHLRLHRLRGHLAAGEDSFLLHDH